MRKGLAFIAHDSKKEDLVELVKAHKEELADLDLVATRDTGQLIQARTGLPVTLLQSSKLGGDLQIGALVANGEVHAVIFYRDPLNVNNQELDVLPLLRVCDIHNVPLATNMGAAEGIIHLLAEHPEAVSGHHLAAEFLHENAYKQD
jgi:methylglyoxal synthase